MHRTLEHGQLEALFLNTGLGMWDFFIYRDAHLSDLKAHGLCVLYIKYITFLYGTYFFNLE